MQNLISKFNEYENFGKCVMSPGFWRYAGFKFLRGIGGCIAFIGILYGLFILFGVFLLGNHLTYDIVLAAFLFVGGLLLRYYADFKIHAR